MQPIGFILFVIGIAITFAAKRIVMAKVKLDEADRNEMEMLAGGAIIAVRVTGFIVAVIGLIFLMM